MDPAQNVRNNTNWLIKIVYAIKKHAYSHCCDLTSRIKELQIVGESIICKQRPGKKKRKQGLFTRLEIVMDFVCLYDYSHIIIIMMSWYKHIRDSYNMRRCDFIV